MVAGRGMYQSLFQMALGRTLTTAEVDEIMSRINGYGPPRWEDTWEYMESQRDKHAFSNFWRSQV